jgi:SOS-response transcriptional repressor LexA
MSIANTISERIISKRKELKLSAVELAKKTDISKARISHWETARRLPGINDAQLLAKALNTTAAYLLCLTDDDKPAAQNDFIELKTIKNSKLINQDEQKLNIFTVVKNLNISPLFALRVSDDSMEPVVSYGDIVVISESLNIAHDDLVLIKTNDGYFLRRVLIDGELFSFHPENDSWASISTKNKSSFTVIGVVKNKTKVLI